MGCTTSTTKAVLDAEKAASTSKFFCIHHSFKEGKAEAWWTNVTALMADTAKYQAFIQATRAAGFYNHSFMPAATEGPILCLWEAKEPCTVAEMQAFIDDNEKSPAGNDTFVNTVFPVLESGMTPASGFPEMPAAPKPTTGSFFWVHHEFNEGRSKYFWEAMSSIDLAEMTKKQNALGYHGHCMLPSAVEGPIFCVWETKEPMSVESFQAFIDGPDGPTPPESPVGGCFKNTVHLAQPGSFTLSAKFTLPDVLMGVQLNDFADWFAGFKEHATSKTFPMNGETYTASLTRGEVCDEAKTDVLVDTADANAAVVVLMAMDMATFGPVMEEPDFKKMLAKAVVSQAPPLLMADMPPPSEPPAGGKLDIFFTYEVEDVDLWVEGFVAHGSSKTGTWGVEAKYARGEFCDEARTRVFKSAYNSKRVGAAIYDVDVAKMGEFMADPSFEKIGEALKFKPETMMLKTITPMPMPEAPIPAAA